jgi:serine/threonine protein kinase
MHLHGLDILHGGITPVSKMKRQVDLHTDAWYIQNNILITQDGQACLADFGFATTFDLNLTLCKLETLRFTAPECLSRPFSGVPYLDHSYFHDPSKEGDIYSIAMTSFNVRSSAVKYSAT